LKQKINVFATVLVMMALNGCYEREHPMPSRVSDADIFVESQPTSAGRLPDVEGLDIGNIRLGKHEKSERLVLDVYKNNKEHVAKKAKNTGSYIYKYDPHSKHLHITLKGYSTCSALGTKKMRSFENSKLIDKITTTIPNKNEEFGIDIDLKRDSTIKIFPLKEPARIVVDINPSL